jgi:serine/threonine protein kinase
MTPVAEPLDSFKSKKELLGAFIDVIEGIYAIVSCSSIHAKLKHKLPAHKRLCKDKTLLHRDISASNIMFDRSGSSDECGRGLLIDFDYAAKLVESNDGESTASNAHRTVCSATIPY